MINYSIVMRSVNANLLEINQAKSRIHPLHGSGLHERDAARGQEDPSGRPG